MIVSTRESPSLILVIRNWPPSSLSRCCQWSKFRRIATGAGECSFQHSGATQQIFNCLRNYLILLLDWILWNNSFNWDFILGPSISRLNIPLCGNLIPCQPRTLNQSHHARIMQRAHTRATNKQTKKHLLHIENWKIFRQKSVFDSDRNLQFTWNSVYAAIWWKHNCSEREAICGTLQSVKSIKLVCLRQLSLCNIVCFPARISHSSCVVQLLGSARCADDVLDTGQAAVNNNWGRLWPSTAAIES